MKRNIFTLEQASIILEPHYSNIYNSIVKGFDDYLKIKNFASEIVRSPITYEGRTNGSIIHDHIKHHISNEYGMDMLVEARKWNNIFALKIENNFLIRFKKLDKSKKISNYQTLQHINFMAQSLIDGFPDEPTFLFAGYIPDKTWTTIKGVYIACWNGKSIEWFDEIGKYCVQQLNLFEEIPSEEQETRLRVRLKGNNNEKPDTNTGTNG
jgi:hypothetical protein